MNREKATVLSAVLAAACLASILHAQTTIEVSKEVLIPALAYEPLGVNNFGGAGGIRATWGNLISNPGFEPGRIRLLRRVILSGEENGRRWITLDGGGTSAWCKYTTGSFSGARMRAYRFVDAEGRPLPYMEGRRVKWAEEGKLLDVSKSAAMVKLFESRVLPKGTPGFPQGGWLCTGAENMTNAEWKKLSPEEKQKLQKGWRVYYEADVPLRMDDVVILRTDDIVWPDPADFNPSTVREATSEWSPVFGSYRYVLHEGVLPDAMDGGKATMELTPAEGKAEVWFKIFGPGNSWYGTLDEGVRYRFEAWAKEVDGEGGALVLGMGLNKPGGLEKGYYGNPVSNRTFPVSKKWQKLGFTFTAPAATGNSVEGAIIHYNGTGRLLVDNVKLQPVYEYGDEDKPFVVYRPLLKTLIDNQPATGRKGMVRYWFGLNMAAMPNLLSWYGEGRVGIHGNVARVGDNGFGLMMTLPRMLTICEATGDTPETRVVPMVTTQVTHDETEYLQLVEYLCAPYDAKKDKPESKPMAYLRFKQRGQGRPWIDDFRELVIDFGNENWHNQANGQWIGLGRRGHIWGGGREYGMWSKYMIEQMRKSPHFNADKLHFNMGGAYHTQISEGGEMSGFQPACVIGAAGTVHYCGAATYIGPRWETGEKTQATINDEGVQRTLLSYRMKKEEEFRTWGESTKRLHEMGYPTRLLAYEGGPSGFGLRAKTREEDRAGEYYGKTLAMGTAVLDSWLDAIARGYVHQCYLSFGQGKWWNSHTGMGVGHRPSPGWLTQTLINRALVNRDMLKVNVRNAPIRTVDIPSPKWSKAPPTRKDVALVRAHATGDDNALAVAVVNLDLDKPHRVTITVPMAKASRITRHYLKGDPRDTNLDELKVKLAEETIDPSALEDGAFTADLEPGKAAIFVFGKAK